MPQKGYKQTKKHKEKIGKSNNMKTPLILIEYYK